MATATTTVDAGGGPVTPRSATPTIPTPPTDAITATTAGPLLK